MSFETEKKVYLDLNFLIDLSNGLGSDWPNPKVKELYELIDSLVRAEKISCPPTTPLYVELQKQSDLSSKLRIAGLMDRWGHGHCLQSAYRVQYEEARDIVLKACGREKEIKSRWKRGAYIVDFDDKAIKADDEIRGRFLEYLKELTIVEIVRQENRDISSLVQAVEKGTEYLNQKKIDAEDEIGSFKDLQTWEVSASLENLFGIICATGEFDHIEGFSMPDEKSMAKENYPTVYSFASYHAMIRYDRTRKYKPNDSFDIEHCCLALGYYDYLLTENSFYTLTTNNLASLDKTFQLKVAKNVEAAIDMLKVLDG